MRLRKFKNKKADMWFEVVSVIAVVVVVIIILYIFKVGIFTQKNNYDYLNSCKAKHGRCVAKEEDCIADGVAFFRSGCPSEITKETGEWCCIPNDDKLTK